MAGPDEERGNDLAALRLLVDTQLQLEATAAKLRSGALSTFVIVVVFALLIERFVYLVGEELVLLTVLPMLVLVVAYLLDRFRYQRAMDRVGERLRAYADGAEASRVRELGDALDLRDSRTTSVVVLYYLLPLVVTAGLLLWRFV